MSSTLTRRRALQAAGSVGATALSGCLFGLRGTQAGYDLTLEPAGSDLRTAFTRERSELSANQASIVEDLQASDAAVRYHDQHLADGEILHVDAYYRVSVTEDGTETIGRPVLFAERVREPESVDDAVQLDRYDAATDGASARRAVQQVVISAHRGRPEPFVFYTDADRHEQLDPEPEYEHVTHLDEVYRLTIADQAVEAGRIEYGWTELSTDGESNDGSADGESVDVAIHDQYRITDVGAADVSEDAEAILVAARDDPPYEASVEFSDAEAELLDVLDLEHRDVGTVTRWIAFAEQYHEVCVDWWHSD